MTSYITEIPPEIMEDVLIKLNSNHIINYCLSHKNATNLCNSREFWLKKLDLDLTLTIREQDGSMRRLIPSHYINYDDVSSGYEIYERFLEASKDQDAIVHALANHHFDIAEWLNHSHRFYKRPSQDQYKWLARSSDTELIWYILRHEYPIDWEVMISSILENNHYDILLYILSNGLYNGTDDLFTFPEINNVLHRIDILELLIEYGFHPNIHNANYAAAHDNLDILIWLESHGILPDVYGANEASGFLDILIWLESHGVLPNVDGANYASSHGFLDVLYWLETYQILPNVDGANGAARGGFLDILIWLEQHGILPNTQGANYAAREGFFPILIWLESYGVLPDTQGANNALSKGFLDILKWLKSYNIIPNAHKSRRNFTLAI